MLRVNNVLRSTSLGALPRHTRLQALPQLQHYIPARHKRSDAQTDSHVVPPVLLNFQDAKAAYESKNTFELFRSRIVLRLCGIDSIVNNNEKLLKFSKIMLPKKMFDSVMRMTFYGQFVGGADVNDLRPKLAKMQEYGVKPILDYSVEADLKEDETDEIVEIPVTDVKFKQDSISSKRNSHQAVARAYPYKGEDSCEENLNIFLECLETASQVCDKNAFSAIKVTGLGKPNALLEGSHFLHQIRELYIKHSQTFEGTLPSYINTKYLPKDVLGPKELLAELRMTLDHFRDMLTSLGADLNESEITDLFDSMSPDEMGHIKFHRFRESCMPGPPEKPLYTVLTKLDLPEGRIRMSVDHLEALNRVEERLIVLCDRAVELDAKILIDAEQTYFQPMIDFFANKMMSRYNKEKVHVFNTYQCYLKSTPSQLIYDADKANVLGYKLGAKLVRGAYMEQERQRALDLDYEDPIYPDKAHTNSCYHNMVEIVLKQIERQKCEVMIASHNEFTIQYVVERMRQSGICPANGGIFFGQLLGMCDQVTYLLGAGGYCSYKYVPYGPIEAVLPYLSRRAYENKGMLKGSQKEIELLKGELKRRRWSVFSTNEG